MDNKEMDLTERALELKNYIVILPLEDLLFGQLFPVLTGLVLVGSRLPRSAEGQFHSWG